MKMAESKQEEPTEKLELPSVPAVTDQERELAQQATEEFDKGNYDACAKIVTKLAETRGQDPRVAHNVAVVEYYKTGFTRTDEYRQAMVGVAAKVIYLINRKSHNRYLMVT